MPLADIRANAGRVDLEENATARRPAVRIQLPVSSKARRPRPGSRPWVEMLPTRGGAMSCTVQSCSPEAGAAQRASADGGSTSRMPPGAAARDAFEAFTQSIELHRLDQVSIEAHSFDA
jgi:hypothetical protein